MKFLEAEWFRVKYSQDTCAEMCISSECMTPDSKLILLKFSKYKTDSEIFMMKRPKQMVLAGAHFLLSHSASNVFFLEHNSSHFET